MEFIGLYVEHNPHIETKDKVAFEVMEVLGDVLSFYKDQDHARVVAIASSLVVQLVLDLKAKSAAAEDVKAAIDKIFNKGESSEQLQN